MVAKGKKKKAKKSLTPSEKAARLHIRVARGVFRNIGLERVPEISGKEFEFEDQAGEFDDVYIYENCIFLIEYTASQPSDVSSHVKKKK